MAPRDILDCVVIGAGPAGLTAAIYLARFQREFLVIDGQASRAAWIPRTRNHPGFPDGVRGKTLLGRMRRQAELYGARIEAGTVTVLRPVDAGFAIALADGRTLAARKVILATGVKDNPLPLAGFEDAVAKSLVRICPICDGYEVRGQRVAVIGADIHAAREAAFLTTYTPHVCLIHTAASATLDAEARAMLAKAGVEILESSIDKVILDRRRIAALCLGPGEPRAFDAVYSALGITPRTRLAIEAGARVDDEGRLYVGAHQETSIPGLYAAGDMVRGLNQISVAEGEGAIAAVDLHNALRSGR
jgi:thioredoxin reductase (NADPH)